MPAKSESQRRLFGMVLRYKRGEFPHAPDKIKRIANQVTMKQAEDFATSLREFTFLNFLNVS